MTARQHEYPQVQLAQGDHVTIDAGGCVNTGGKGKTSKLYVNPLGENSDHLYHGLISIAGVTSGLQRLQALVGKELRLPIDGTLPASQPLVLGYEDDQYDDNTYNQDEGNPPQCAGVGDAFVLLTITHDPWSAWTEIPGNGQGIAPPAAAFFYRKLRVFVPGLDQGIAQNTFDGTRWTGWHALPIGGQTRVQLAPVAFAGLYLFHTGLDGHIYYAVQTQNDDNAWGPWQQVPGDVMTSLPVAVAQSNDGLSLLARDASGRLFLNQLAPDPPTSSNLAWRGWKAFDDGQLPVGIAVSANNDGANARVVAVDAKHKVRSREWQNQPSTPTVTGAWTAWTEEESYPIKGSVHPGLLPLSVNATQFTLQANLRTKLLVRGPDGSTWAPLPALDTVAPIPGASKYKGGQSPVPGMADLYFFAVNKSQRFFYTARGPVVPFPPPPQIKIDTFAPFPRDYVNAGTSVELRWTFTANESCPIVDASLNLRLYGQPSQQILSKPAVTSPGAFTVTPAGTPLSYSYYTLHVVCRGSSASDTSDETSVQLAGVQPSPTGIAAVNGPNIAPIELHENQEFTVTYWFENIGGATLGGGDVALFLDGEKVGDDKTVQDLAPGAATPLMWTVSKKLTGPGHWIELRFVKTGGVYGHYDLVFAP